MEYGKGGPSGGQEKMALVIWHFYEKRGGKVEVAYAYNGEWSSICDPICDSTGVAPGGCPLE